MTEKSIDRTIERVRHFNRFYTRQIGVVSGRYLGSPYSLTEARILYELAGHGQMSVTQLAAELGLDTGYISRLLGGLRKRDLLEMNPGENDGRQRFIRLSEKGMAAFGELDRLSQQDMEKLLQHLTIDQRHRLAACMQTIENLLYPSGGREQPLFLLREHRPGDMGWIIYRQMLLYQQEYGWNEEFEALVSEICAGFIRNFDARYERCWVAERDGEIVGAVFVAKKSESTAQLRMLYVEPDARGLGIGKRLVDECIHFARQVGYSEIILWTQSVLTAARHIYQRAGFQIIAEEANHRFGKDLVSETWRLVF